MEDAPRKFFRLSVGREVRLRYAYYITCTDVIKDADGNITELHCTYDPETKGGDSSDGRKVKGTLHWVCANNAKPATINLYDRLFTEERPDADKEKPFTDFLNPDSLKAVQGFIEPYLATQANPGYICQFERTGYFCADKESSTETPIFNRTVPLRDSWAKKKG